MTRFTTPLFLLGLACLPTLQARSIGWWWSPPSSTTPDRQKYVAGFLDFVGNNTKIVSTLMMSCDIRTCCRLGCGECGNAKNSSCANPRGRCSNNGGVGGVISGTLDSTCAQVLPTLEKLGIKVELWLGEDDSLSSAQYLFAHADETAAALIAVAKQHPGISGFNVDPETKGGTVADAKNFVRFLSSVAAQLAPSNLRFSADVACNPPYEGGESRPVATNCTLLGSAGAGVHLMNMGTYNAHSYASWYSSFAAAQSTVPQEMLGVGLGCWIDSRTNNTWSITPQSADDRVCLLMNTSVAEIDMFEIK